MRALVALRRFVQHHVGAFVNVHRLRLTLSTANVGREFNVAVALRRRRPLATAPLASVAHPAGACRSPD